VHVPDGFLSPQITLPALGAAVPLWALAARRHFGPEALEAIPALGGLTAVAFALQTVAVPVPGGTSAHLVGAALLALHRGPLAAFACESLVLLLQALFFGTGGVTVLGVNALALGLLGPLAGWLAFLGLRRLSPRMAHFAAGWLALQVSALAVAGALALQHRLDPGYLPVPGGASLLSMMLPSLAVSGPAEALFTLAAMAVLRRARLDGAAA